MTSTDLSMNDLSMNDLSMNDLSMNDLSMNDLSKKTPTNLATGVVWVALISFPLTETKSYKHLCPQGRAGQVELVPGHKASPW